MNKNLNYPLLFHYLSLLGGSPQSHIRLATVRLRIALLVEIDRFELPPPGDPSLGYGKSGIIDSREVSEGPSVSSSGIGSIRGLGSIRSISLSSISYGSGRSTDSISEHLG